jgi:hypothetical protein
MNFNFEQSTYCPDFYILYEGISSSAAERIAIIEKACSRAGLICIPIDSLNFDHRRIPKLNPGDILFN